MNGETPNLNGKKKKSVSQTFSIHSLDGFISKGLVWVLTERFIGFCDDDDELTISSSLPCETKLRCPR